MKIIIRILLFTVIGLIGSGLYLQTIKAEKAELLIGSGVLILAFLLIPLFVYHGYKGKDLTRYSFKNMQGPEEKEKQ
jgi:hypothetical protein